MRETRKSIEENAAGDGRDPQHARIPSVTDKYNTDFNAMLDEMAKDGLIDRDDYKIKKEGGELYIDGKRQPETVYQKYRHYLREKNMTLKGKGNVISIAITDEQ